MTSGRAARDMAIGVLATAGVLVILRLGLNREPDPDIPGNTLVPETPIVALPADSGPPDPPAAPGEISVLTLLAEMADLDHLARLPDPPFVAGQAASTDRRSRRPDDTAGWFANDDFVTETQANLVRVEDVPGGGKRYVLLDVAGPGAVVRIWTATPAGTLRLYVDDDPRPVLEARAADLLGGRVAPFAPPFAHVAARGYNLYFPFPYARRCVITLDSIVSPDPFTGRPMAKVYHQIGYRTYPTAVANRIRPAAAAEIARARAEIARVGAALRDDAPAARVPPGAQVTAIPDSVVTSDRPVTLALTAPAGGARITELLIATDERAPDKLRGTWLAATFDGVETVRAPLVDFFATGPTIAPYRSLPMTVRADGVLACRFPMPFRNRAVISLSRTAPGGVRVDGRVTVAAAPFDDRSLLFHAGWRPRVTMPTRPLRDWHVGGVTGRGQLVGAALNVENPPGAGWWGEGDEKIYVDGEAFPSWFGTGTEDYFGYAWSTTETFAHAYHAQTRAPAGGFPGVYSMNRFHVLDPIPFSRSLRFDLEIWHWTETTIAADAMLYWYARPNGTDDFR
jgi:hypothetical protein